MRTYNQDSFHSIPSNYPLKSPSPDMKGRSSIPQTFSPHSTNFRKSFNNYTPPPNRVKNQVYADYATLPHFSQEITQDTKAKIDKIFSNSKNNFDNQRQYSSTHAKGHYVFEMPQQIPTNFVFNQRDMITTGKKVQYFQQNSHQPSTPVNLKNIHFVKVIEQKDMVISELKDMIKLMTQNGKHLKMSHKVYHEQEYENTKNDVKILTIQNQKLSEIIDKLKQKTQMLMKNQQNLQISNKNKTKNQKDQQFSTILAQKEHQNLKQRLKQHQNQVNHLKQILQQKQIDHQSRLDQLKKLNQNLTIESKFFQNEKERYSKENQRLINLLRLKDKEKQTCYNNYSYFDKSQYDGSSENNGNNLGSKNSLQTNKNSTEQSAPGNTRLSIQKIKAQYEQNLKLYKQNVYNEVYMMFDTINLTLEEINQKINGMEDKIVEMEKFKDSWKQRARSHLTSIEQNEEEIKKSAIYIEEAPSSSRMDSSSGKSHQALSVILQESRRDNEKLQLEISQLKKQVEHYKETLQQKLSIKNSESQEEISQSYEKRIIELQGLLDQLRQEKQIMENQLSELKMQKIKSEKLHYQSTKLTELTEDHIGEQLGGNTQRLKLQEQISLLRQKLQQKQRKEHLLLQKVKQLQMAESQRQKQLLSEIQRFQTLIKETQQEFKSTKEDYENQINSLNQEVEYLKSEEVKNKMDSLFIKKDNEKLKQKILSLENTLQDSVKNEQNLQKIQSLVRSFNKNSKDQDFYLSIKSYIESLESQISNKNHDRNELIKITEAQKQQILELQQIKIDLNQRVIGLEEKLKLYKIQFQKSKQFYSKFLQSQEEQKISSKSSKNKAKLKIDQLLNSQNKKINQLIDSIANLSNINFSNEQTD